VPPDPAAESLRLLHQERRQLEAELDELARRLEDLRGFEGEYRARLIAYLDGLVTTLKMEGSL
jgi:hypothetical protein